MKIQELRQMTTEKLVELLKKTRREASTTRFRLATGQNKNSAELKNMRLLIAQIKTLLHEQKLADIAKK